jgi:hypothetical protein
MHSASRLIVLLSVFVLGLSSFVGAQSSTSLYGTLYDAKGAVVPGAELTLNNPATGFSRTTKSDAQGAYQFLQVPPATYAVTVTAAGFAQIKQTDLVLQVSTPATMDFTLQVQGSEVRVEVTGVAPLVNTQDASQGHAFDASQLISLPAEGRDAVAILSLQPGVTYLGQQSHDTQDQDSRSGSVNGARSDQTNVMLDGLDNNDQLRGYAFEGALRTTLDSLQEFRVTTTSANADAGRSSGAQVNLVTKSGTNSFHGSLYEYNRNAFTAANDWFNKQAQIREGLPNRPGQLIRNTFGASIGGPIKKDRVFFFTAFEGQRTRESDQITQTIPSEFLRQGIMRYKCDQTDPACATSNPDVQVVARGDGSLVATLTPAQFASMDPNAFGNGQCPWADVNGNCGADPNVLTVFNQYPEPNTDTLGDGLDFRAFTFAGNHPRKLNTYIVKLDFKLDNEGKHAIFLRGNLQNDNESTAPQFPGLPGNDFITNNSKGIAAGYTALLSNTLINNFRWAFIRQGLGDAGLATSNLADFRGLADPVGFSRTILTNVPVHNFVDDLSWTKGRHTIQFGTSQRFIYNNRQSNAQNFSNALTNVFWLDKAGIATTGTSLDPSAFGFPAVDQQFSTDYDFATAAVAGLLTQVTSIFNQDKNGALATPGSLISRHFKNWEGEWYVQDAWRMKPNLTLTLGLRYSMLQTPYETHGEQAAPTLSVHDWFNQRGQDMLQGVSTHPEITFDLSGQSRGRKPYWNWDYRDLAPRFAFAYSPNFDSGFMHRLFGGSGKSSIRGGYGIYFDHFGEGVINTFDRQGAFGLTTSILNPAGFQAVDTTARFTNLTTVPTSSATPGCPLLSPPPPHGFPFSPPNDPCFGFAIAWGLDDKLKTPYSHAFDFSITRELPNNFVVEASYIGRLGRRLLQEADLAMPLDLVDTKSKTDYFKAATQLSKASKQGVDINSLPTIPYWENMFPGAAGNLGFGPPGDPANLGCAPGDSASSTNYTATQAMYDMYSCFTGNETTALFNADLFCLPACSGASGGQPFAYWDDQFSSLYAWRSQGNSSYHAMQLSLRRPAAKGLQFDFNYTFSKSIDVGSNAERINIFELNSQGFSGGFGDQVINSWAPNQLRAVSDFDTKHQFNSNWVWELPVGRGRHFGGSMGRMGDAFLGGWSLAGLFHWTSGLPFGIIPGAGWPTNWELQGLAVQTGSTGGVGTFTDSNGDPNMFKNPSQAINAFRNPFPGESGQRNELRGPGYFGIDAGLGKSWKFAEQQGLSLRWEVFNVTNSVRFDAALSAINEALTDSGSFGKYQATLTQSRRMQLSLRYSF